MQLHSLIVENFRGVRSAAVTFERTTLALVAALLRAIPDALAPGACRQGA